MNRFEFFAIGIASDGGGFPAQDRKVDSYQEAMNALNRPWPGGDGFIEVHRDGDLIAHVAYRGGKHEKTYKFKRS